MLFPESIFLFYFLPAALLLGALTNCFQRGPQFSGVAKLTLFLLTLVFYGFKNPWWLVPFLFSVGFDFVWAFLLDRTSHPALRRLWVTLSVAQNVGLLATFKYSELLSRFLKHAWPAADFILPKFLLDGTPLPLAAGISFYTFESMSFVIDVYRRDATVPKNPLTFLSFIGMFPRFVAGPIVRYPQMAKQFAHYQGMQLERGLTIFFYGLFLKVGFGDNFAPFCGYATFDPEHAGFLAAWIGIVAFYFRVYFDFSGYSLMAIGLGQCLGFDFPRNFDSPYTATSLTDYWRRWHITLSQWFRDYLYLPLGGSRKGTARTCFNLFLTLTVAGAWHGPTLNFLVWGMWHGLFLVGERLTGHALQKNYPKVSWVVTFLLIVFGFALFVTPDLGHALLLQKALLSPWRWNSGFNPGPLAARPLSAAICLLGVIYCYGIEPRLRGKPPEVWKSLKVRLVGAALFLVALILNLSANTIPFLYFQF